MQKTLTLLIALSSLSQVALANETKVIATVQQRVHPVLIGKSYNCLLHVEIHAPRKGIRLNSITFTFAGCDNVRDFSELQTFYSAALGPKNLDRLFSGTRFRGDRAALLKSLTTRFGNKFDAQHIIESQRKVTVRGAQVLNRGKNIVWLSCTVNPKASLGRRLDAACVQVSTSRGNAELRDRSGRVRKRIGVALRQFMQDRIHTSRIPALATSRQGTLLCVFDMRRRKRRDLQEDIDIGLHRSTDGGQTWHRSQVIMDMGTYGGLPQEKNGCSDPGIVVDQQTGEIFCGAVWMWGKLGKHQWDKGGSEKGFEIGKSAQYLMVRSRDDGKSWTKPENMTRKLKQRDWILYAPSPQQGITLRDGTLVMVGEGRDSKERMFSNLMVSKDHGRTWKVGASLATGNGECQAVELADGTIMLNARSTRPTKFRSIWITRDLGKSWLPHPTHRKSLIEPNCNGSLYRFDYVRNGKNRSVLIFANPHSQKGRTHHTLQVSLDEGKTWPKRFHLLLDEGQGNGYPSLSKVDGEHIGIVYEGSQSHVVFEKISLKELGVR